MAGISVAYSMSSQKRFQPINRTLSIVHASIQAMQSASLHYASARSPCQMYTIASRVSVIPVAARTFSPT